MKIDFKEIASNWYNLQHDYTRYLDGFRKNKLTHFLFFRSNRLRYDNREYRNMPDVIPVGYELEFEYLGCYDVMQVMGSLEAPRLNRVKIETLQENTMLIEVIKENEVVSCRLTTGEELVARLKKDKREDGYVELDTPLIVGRSAEGFGLMPYMMTVNPESTVSIKMEHVLSMAKTNDEISKGYTKQTSKIETL